MESEAYMDVPTPRPDQGSFGESLKFKMRRARIQELERQQEIQDSFDVKMTEEQFQTLVHTFASIEFEGYDLDGLSWSDPKWQSMHALWNATHPSVRPRTDVTPGPGPSTPIIMRRTCPEMPRSHSVRSIKRMRSGIFADETLGLRTSASMHAFSADSWNSYNAARLPRRRPASLVLFDSYCQTGSSPVTDAQLSPGFYTPRSPRQGHFRAAGCPPLRHKRYSASTTADRRYALLGEEIRR